jgi:hypothetical protein
MRLLSAFALLAVCFARSPDDVAQRVRNSQTSAGLAATPWKSVQVQMANTKETLSPSTTVLPVWVGLKVSEMASQFMCRYPWRTRSI